MVPAISALYRQWMPKEERAFALAIPELGSKVRAAEVICALGVLYVRTGMSCPTEITMVGCSDTRKFAPRLAGCSTSRSFSSSID